MGVGCGQSHAAALRARQVMAKQEATTRPCPRTVLVCCATLLTTGPSTPKIFEETVAQDLVPPPPPPPFFSPIFEHVFGCQTCDKAEGEPSVGCAVSRPDAGTLRWLPAPL